jgi:hypothetical protein
METASSNSNIFKGFPENFCWEFEPNNICEYLSTRIFQEFSKVHRPYVLEYLEGKDSPVCTNFLELSSRIKLWAASEPLRPSLIDKQSLNLEKFSLLSRVSVLQMKI